MIACLIAVLRTLSHGRALQKAIIGNIWRRCTRRKRVTKDFAAVLEKLRHGAEVVVEQDRRPVAVISPVKDPGRPIDECITLPKARGSGGVLDENSAQDLR